MIEVARQQGNKSVRAARAVILPTATSTEPTPYINRLVDVTKFTSTAQRCLSGEQELNMLLE